jgi:FtsZ-binding cell division protein ZapB
MSDGPGRSVPDDLSASWSNATADPDPLAALSASGDLARGIDRWQATLVAEAVREGATWEQIGERLGISRQAAWARFRDAVDQEGRGRMENDTAELRERIQVEVRSLREAMRTMDDEHRQARQEAMSRIREMDRRIREERQALKERVKATVRSLQEEYRGRRRPG